MSFIRLMQDVGTTLKDATHSLVVYKIDHKKFDDTFIDYLRLASTVDEIKNGGYKMQITGLSANLKENFQIGSNICSTKLTQNGELGSKIFFLNS